MGFDPLVFHPLVLLPGKAGDGLLVDARQIHRIRSEPDLVYSGVDSLAFGAQILELSIGVLFVGVFCVQQANGACFRTYCQRLAVARVAQTSGSEVVRIDNGFNLLEVLVPKF